MNTKGGIFRTRVTNLIFSREQKEKGFGKHILPKMVCDPRALLSGTPSKGIVKRNSDLLCFVVSRVVGKIQLPEDRFLNKMLM